LKREERSVQADSVAVVRFGAPVRAGPFWQSQGARAKVPARELVRRAHVPLAAARALPAGLVEEVALWAPDGTLGDWDGASIAAAAALARSRVAVPPDTALLAASLVANVEPEAFESEHASCLPAMLRSGFS
jgi:hypothetical protein